MAGLENLVSSIYHEKQQSGSMLCAQHALNNLLQGNYFTAPDLSDIASNLDALERSYDGTHSHSTNMDDTGFFSVQVLESALTVWGLNLTRWRGEDMRPYQDHPQNQLAFILNLNQHWFTLRRFGHAEPNINNDVGNGHWFNLNSFLPQPEWVGKLYLGMVLQQAESEGYSVFAVTQVDPSAPLGLSRTIADEIASTLPEPTSSNAISHRPLVSKSAPSVPDHIEGLEDEDYELQAALQASLMGNHYSIPPPVARSSAQFSHANLETPSTSRVQTGLHSSANEEDEGHDDVTTGEKPELDPVAASMARSQLMLQRMKAHQELAQRELWDEGSLNEADAAALEERRARRQREETDEAEQLRRAIAESEALAQAQGHAPRTDDDNERVGSVNIARPEPNPLQGYHHDVGARVYDDDDVELQAALKASLEHVPQGWEFPELPSPPARSRPVQTLTRAPTVASTRIETEVEDRESILSEDVEDSGDHKYSDPTAETVSVDELRRKRLARFGM
ncbi:Ataxin-3 [Termitomyces sp. T112]|nr:Ataxin-3 [Termitomyces sp. T112]